jgi:hypothetical protein
MTLLAGCSSSRGRGRQAQVIDEKSSVTAFFVQRRSNGPSLAYWRLYLLLLGLESPLVG